MIGTRLGQYRIDALLGRGGMGAVYRATDEMLGRQVAIKVLREDADAQGNAAERFRGEAQILSRLDHPHILRLYGFSQDAGVLYMVTEYVKGEALQRRLEQGTPMPAGQVLEWAGQVLDALEYAHQIGVVHRDIKPANILIDERNRARLLDFGIARIVGTEGLTQTGHAVGTLMYMAPEQVLDEAIDGRTDLYAFAIVLCQLFAGRRPYRATTTAGLIREIVDGPTPDVAAFLPPHAAAFGPALRHALARRPSDRTPSAGRMWQELREAASSPVLPPIPVPPTPVFEPPRVTPSAVPPAPEPVTPPLRERGGDEDASLSGAARPGASPATAPTPLTPSRGPTASPQRRRPGALVYVVPTLLVAATIGVAWFLVGPSRLVTPRVAMAPSGEPAGAAASAPVAPLVPEVPPPPGTSAQPDHTVPASPEPAAASPTATSSVPPAPKPAVTVPRPATPARTGTGPATATTAVREPAPPPPEPGPAVEASSTIEPEAPRPASAPAPSPAAAPATVEFKDVILIDRVDDEDEELDVSVRLDASRVVVLDEDGIAKRSIAYDAIGRATYNTRKPGRFSLRRGPSHWLTLEIGITPVVLRLNGRTYEQLLATLAAHGVHVVRNP